MENQKEIWKDIAGFEGLYQVSSFGRVKSFYGKKEHILRPGNQRNNYLFVILCKDGKRKSYLVHRLVANAFIPNPNKLPVINHLDENKQNNFVSNIEWCSYSYNNSYNDKAKKAAAKLINGPCSKKVGQYSHAGKLIKIWPSIHEAARQGFNHGHIWSCCQGRLKTHAGFKWRYIEN